MYFGGASRSPMGSWKEEAQDNVVRIRILLVSLDNALILYSLSHTTRYSNNTTEYEAVIARLKLALQISFTSITIYGDSDLVVKQLHREYSMRNMKLVPYHNRAE